MVFCAWFCKFPHCHLELSHLKRSLRKKTGLPDFISNVIKKRNVELSDIKKSIIDADTLMQKRHNCCR